MAARAKEAPPRTCGTSCVLRVISAVLTSVQPSQLVLSEYLLILLRRQTALLTTLAKGSAMLSPVLRSDLPAGTACGRHRLLISFRFIYGKGGAVFSFVQTNLPPLSTPLNANTPPLNCATDASQRTAISRPGQSSHGQFPRSEGHG